MSGEGKTSRFALTFIFLTMLIDTIGLGIIIPVSPGMIAELTHETLSGAARWGGWLFFSYALMQFLCAPLIGNLSDRFGRRPVLILSLVMLGVDYLITGLAPTIAWLFVGRTLSGMAGAAYPTANAYIADISPPEKRAANFGLVGAAFGVGICAGTGGGRICGRAFRSAGALLRRRRLFLCQRPVRASGAARILARRTPPAHSNGGAPIRWGRSRRWPVFPHLAVLLAVLVLVQFAHDSLPSTWTYYTMLKFGWGLAMSPGRWWRWAC